MSHPLPHLPALQPPRLHLPKFRDEAPPAAPEVEPAALHHINKASAHPGGGRITLHLDRDLDQRLRNAAHATGSSIAQLCIAGLAAHVVHLEERHHDGQPFPQRPSLRERIHAARPTASEPPEARDAG